VGKPSFYLLFFYLSIEKEKRQINKLFAFYVFNQQQRPAHHLGHSEAMTEECTVYLLRVWATETHCSVQLIYAFI
jgi:hypothetical protein